MFGRAKRVLFSRPRERPRAVGQTEGWSGAAAKTSATKASANVNEQTLAWRSNDSFYSLRGSTHRVTVQSTPGTQATTRKRNEQGHIIHKQQVINKNIVFQSARADLLYSSAKTKDGILPQVGAARVNSVNVNLRFGSFVAFICGILCLAASDLSLALDAEAQFRGGKPPYARKTSDTAAREGDK